MVDNMNPTNQFHPYQPVDAIPVSERAESAWGGFLRKLGIDSKSVKLNDALGRARRYAKSNPGVVLGGLVALAIGAGLMWRRA